MHRWVENHAKPFNSHSFHFLTKAFYILRGVPVAKSTMLLLERFRRDNSTFNCGLSSWALLVLTALSRVNILCSSQKELGNNTDLQTILLTSSGRQSQWNKLNMPIVTGLLCRRIPGFLSRWVPGRVSGESSELIPKTTDLILKVYLIPLNRVSKGHLLIVAGAPIGSVWEIYFFPSLKTFNLETFSSFTKCKNILKRMSSTLWLDSPTLNILHYLSFTLPLSHFFSESFEDTYKIIMYVKPFITEK